MKLGIFGGTFDPVHREHVQIAVSAIKELQLDKLYIMPNHIPPHKRVLPTADDDRHAMLRIAFEGVDKVEISAYETEKESVSFTYQTVEYFNSADTDLYFIVGSDMLVDFKTWRNPEKILNNCTLCVFDRQGFEVNYKEEENYFKEHFNKTFLRLNFVGGNVSSTAIRVYSAFGLNVTDYVDSGVSDYIKSKNIYPSDRYIEFVKSKLTEKRLIHTANVVVCALKQAKKLNLPEEKVKISATLHDCAKYLNPNDYLGFKIPNDMPSPVVHAYLGAYVAEKELGICDEEIINAIKYHTSGRAMMTDLEKLIFVADMIEQGRHYQGVEELRKFYDQNFELCFRKCLEEEMVHLINKKTKIFIETINAFDYYIKKS